MEIFEKDGVNDISDKIHKINTVLSAYRSIRSQIAHISMSITTGTKFMNS